MNWHRSNRSRLLLTAALTSLCLSGCGTAKFRLDQAYTAKAKAETTPTALAEAEKRVQEARRMPQLPAKCRETHHSGVLLNDRQDVANVKTDNALGAANGQISWCAVWYDRNAKAREPKP